MKGKEFGLQLDEATDSNKYAHLICYVRFLDDSSIVEDLLFYKPINVSGKAQDLFQILVYVVLNKIKFMTENNLDRGSVLDFVLMAFHQCLVSMEDYKRLFAVEHRILCGPIALFIRRYLHRSR